jgi:hypothetical protein
MNNEEIRESEYIQALLRELNKLENYSTATLEAARLVETRIRDIRDELEFMENRSDQ